MAAAALKAAAQWSIRADLTPDAPDGPPRHFRAVCVEIASLAAARAAPDSLARASRLPRRHAGIAAKAKPQKFELHHHHNQLQHRGPERLSLPGVT